MARRNRSSPISFFSFQDIIMSVVGIIILVTLLLILKLIAQMALAETTPTPEFTEAELNERIESLEQARREIQDEIAIANRVRQQAAPHVPTLPQIDALRTSKERLESDMEKIEEDIETAKTRQEELRNRPDAKIVLDKQAKIRELEQKKKEAEQRNQSLSEQDRNLREKLDDLKKQAAGLDRQLAEEVAKKLYVTPHQSTDKTPYILVYGSGSITVLSLTDSTPKPFTSRNDFFNWAQSRDKNKEYFVLYIRPSRFGEYESILERLKKSGFDVGLQVLGEDTDISLQ